MSETVNAELPQSSICITLYSHGDTTYHWAIVAPIDRYYAAKFHATNRGSAGWLYKPWQYKSVDEVLSSSRTAVVVVKIGGLLEALSIIPGIDHHLRRARQQYHRCTQQFAQGYSYDYYQPRRS